MCKVMYLQSVCLSIVRAYLSDPSKYINMQHSGRAIMSIACHVAHHSLCTCTLHVHVCLILILHGLGSCDQFVHMHGILHFACYL